MGEWPLVAENDDGIRPAGPQDECFYCHQKIGKPHGKDCVIVEKVIKVRYTFEIEIKVPHHWGKKEFEFHRNESSSCFNNVLGELEAYGDSKHGCLCGIGHAKYLGVVDATPTRELREPDEASNG
jgi:hypothetical protein